MIFDNFTADELVDVFFDVIENVNGEEIEIDDSNKTIDWNITIHHHLNRGLLIVVFLFE